MSADKQQQPVQFHDLSKYGLPVQIPVPIGATDGTWVTPARTGSW